jgi:hypothetical protein
MAMLLSSSATKHSNWLWACFRAGHLTYWAGPVFMARKSPIYSSEPKARSTEPELSNDRCCALRRRWDHGTAAELKPLRQVISRGKLLPNHSWRWVSDGLVSRDSWGPRTEGSHSRAQCWIWRGVDESEGRAGHLGGWGGCLSRRQWPGGRSRSRLW